MKPIFPLLLTLTVLFRAESGCARTAQASPALIGGIPVTFTPAVSEPGVSARFTAHLPGGGLLLSPDGATFVLSRETAASRARRAARKSVVFLDAAPAPEPAEIERYVLTVRFLGGNAHPVLTGEDRLPWNTNTFQGSDPAQWKTDVPNYAKVRCRDIYPGVDLVYSGAENRVKYDLIIQPGSDLSNMAFAYEGATGVRVNGAGDLEVETPLGGVIEKKPYSYQVIGGKRIGVDVRFVIRDEASGAIGFAAETYDPRYPLTIDPELVYSSFLGGTGLENWTRIAVDRVGCVYIAGITQSADFPVTPGAYQTITSDTEYGDIFVTKFDPGGATILFSTYIRGERYEDLSGIIVDDAGDILLAGDTYSKGYPVTPGAYTTDRGTDHTFSLFLTKLSAQGNALVFSSVFGESIHSRSAFLGMDGSGHAYLTARGIIDPTPGVLQEERTNEFPAYFVCKFAIDGSKLLYATYYGGTIPENDGTSSVDSVLGFAVDREGNAYLTGYAGHRFSLTEGALDSHLGGYLCKISPGGDKLLFSTFLFSTYPYALALGADECIYLFTSYGSFPFITPGTYTSTKWRSSVLFKLKPDGSEIVRAARIFETGYNMAVDRAGRVFLYGKTPEIQPPVTPDAINPTPNDLHFCVFDATFSTLLYATYLGGSGMEYPGGIATDDRGNVYLSGTTFSGDFPTTEGAFDRAYSGEGDAFFCKFSFDSGPVAVEESPRLFSLNPARPNPFNPSTTISFTLPAPGNATLAVSSITGQKVRTLLSGSIAAGAHEVTWDGRDDGGTPVSSGVYLSRLESGGMIATGKMLLVK